MIIDTLVPLLDEKKAILAQWWSEKTSGLRLPITCSVDVRNAGFKLAVIDTNLFPAGFNNLCNGFLRTAAQAFKQYVEREYPSAKKILLIPETFTRNLNYFKSVKSLEKLIQNAGFQVKTAFLGDPFPKDPHRIVVDGEKDPLLLYRPTIIQNFQPDVVVLNNDCSEGIPPFLKTLEVPILPSPALGWHQRSKYHHIQIFCLLLHEWAALLKVDGWRFCPLSQLEENVAIDNPKGLEKLAFAAETLLKKIEAKYRQYHVEEKPFLFLKDDAGTFGLGVLPIESPKDILQLNRKGRKQLSTRRSHREATSFLLQEGVPTADRFQGAPTEPVLYFIGGEPIGGFYRIHADKDAHSSLNAPGAKFDCLCLHKTDELLRAKLELHCDSAEKLFQLARWLGKIACLAASLEEQELR